MKNDTDVRWTVAQLELSNLVSRVAHIADTGSLDDYADCFAEDAEWSPPINPGVDVPPEPAFGLETILAFARDRRKRGVQGPGTNTRHVVSTSEFVVTTPDSAHGVSYWQYYTHTNETPLLATQGEYHDEFIRINGKWRLSKRHLLRG